MNYFDNPGGMIPTWLVNWAAKVSLVLLDSVQNLRAPNTQSVTQRQQHTPLNWKNSISSLKSSGPPRPVTCKEFSWREPMTGRAAVTAEKWIYFMKTSRFHSSDGDQMSSGCSTGRKTEPSRVNHRRRLVGDESCDPPALHHAPSSALLQHDQTHSSFVVSPLWSADRFM